MSSSEKFAEYMLRSRAQAMISLHKYDLQVGRLYLDLAEEVKAELKAASGFREYHLRTVLNSLMKAADQATEGFRGVIDKAMLESADIQTRGFAQAMADYWDAIDPASLGIDPKRMLIKVPDRAVKMVYLRTHENGLQLADSIWRLGQNSRQGVARLVTEAVARGFHYDDPRLAQQLDRFLQPTRWETATVKGKKVTRPKRVSPSITRNIKDPNTGEISKYTFRQRPVSYDAARILRTEVTNAYREASHLTASQNPACTGEMWVLSNFHPDIGCDCENYAVHDEGLGEGVFSLGNFPITPHPQCLCTAMQVVVEMDVFMGWVEDFMNGGSGKIADWYGKYGLEMAA